MNAHRGATARHFVLICGLLIVMARRRLSRLIKAGRLRLALSSIIVFIPANKDYKMVFTNTKHYCFDETNFKHDEFSGGKNYQEIPSEIESMMHVVRKLEAENYLKPYFDLHIIEGLARETQMARRQTVLPGEV